MNHTVVLQGRISLLRRRLGSSTWPMMQGREPALPDRARNPSDVRQYIMLVALFSEWSIRYRSMILDLGGGEATVGSSLIYSGVRDLCHCKDGWL